MIRRRPRHTIRMRLFLSYSVLIFATLITLDSVFWIYTSNVLRRRTTSSLEALSTSLLERIDQEVQTMDEISLNVAFANLTRSQLQNRLGSTAAAEDPLPALLSSILGPFETVPELYVHERGGRTVAAGLYSGTVPNTDRSTPCIVRARSLNGDMFLSLPHPDRFIESQIRIYKGREFVSLCRSYYDGFGRRLGVIEVEQKVATLFGKLAAPVSGRSHTDIVVYNGNGSVMFRTGSIPKAILAVSFPSMHAAQRSDATTGTGSFTTRVPNSQEVYAFSRSTYSGLTVLTIEPASFVFAPVYTFSRVLISGGILALLITLMLSYFVARWLTIPIRGLHNAILELDGERLLTTEPERVRSNLDELEELNVAFQRMHLTLRDSVKDLVTLRSHEETTRMLALQSQMKPHFLYNTLANISVMAEEGMDDDIIRLCADLTAMYRYLGDGFSNLTTLEEELSFTSNYLSCMTYRLNVPVTCTVDADEAVRRIQIPKLTVQPMVENVLKYGIVAGRPLAIEISASFSETRWTVSVRDNGKGFSKRALMMARSRLRAIEATNDFEQYRSDGVGITNIYARLRILYGGDASIAIDETPQEGSHITIGGLLHARFGA